MTRFAFLLSVLLSLVPSSFADQGPPYNLKIGADFAWHLVSSDSVEDAKKFGRSNVHVELDSKSVSLLDKSILASLKQIRSDVEPKIVIVHQTSYGKEQKALFALSSRKGVNKFIRLRLVGDKKALYIMGVEELSFDQAASVMLEGRKLEVVPSPAPKP